MLQLVRALREAGVPVILVTHNMQDAFAVADRLLVMMRRGRLVGEGSPSTTSVSELVSLMLGATEARV